jgi:hypothetical protein
MGSGQVVNKDGYRVSYSNPNYIVVIVAASES